MSKEDLKQNILTAVKNDPNIGIITSVSLFGSQLHCDADKNSDVDILIEFDPKSTIGFFKLAQIRRNIANHVGREIDLVTPSALSEYFRDQVINEAETIYERR